MPFVSLTLLVAAALFPAHENHAGAAALAQSGVTQAQLGKYNDAIESYKRAIAIDPSLPAINLNLGLAYFKLGDFKNAAAAFEREDSVSHTDRVTTLLAMSYFGLGKYRDAAVRLLPVADAQPSNFELSYLLAKCYLWSNQLDRATALFRQLLERDPQSAAVHMLLGEAFDAQRRLPEAIAELEAAASSAPNQPDVHFGLGYLYWKDKQFAKAEAEFRLELQHNPQSGQANAYLGDVLMRSGRKDEAKAALIQACALRNDLHLAHQDLAFLYEEDNESEKAIGEFRKAIRTDPSNYDSHYRLGRLYRQLGRTSEANAEFAIVQKLHAKKAAQSLMQVSGPQ